jgi:hypothetical protein
MREFCSENRCVYSGLECTIPDLDGDGKPDLRCTALEENGEQHVFTSTCNSGECSPLKRTDPD